MLDFRDCSKKTLIEESAPQRVAKMAAIALASRSKVRSAGGRTDLATARFARGFNATARSAPQHDEKQPEHDQAQARAPQSLQIENHSGSSFMP